MPSYGVRHFRVVCRNGYKNAAIVSVECEWERVSTLANGWPTTSRPACKWNINN